MPEAAPPVQAEEEQVEAAVPIREGKLDEYLEEIFAERYKRQLDQEENVARTLPFFAAALAVLANIVGLLRPSIPSFSTTLFSISVHVFLAGLAVCIFYSI